MKTIQYKTKQITTTEITIGENIIKNLPSLVNVRSYTKIGIITDSTVKKFHAKKITSILKKINSKFTVISIPDGEKSKSFNRFEKIQNKLIAEGFDRNSTLIALGGGVVTDITGFVAATYMRGIDWIAIPTTLLGQADAAIGGKTGINSNGIKNMIGSFHQPITIICDVSLLKTLTPRTFKSGLAEIIKYGIIFDKNFFEYFANKKTKQFSSKELINVISQCVKFKTNAIESDTKEETGQRALLNFGHTIGHAIETIEKGKWSHGEAISVGMIAASRLSEKILNLPYEKTEIIKIVFKKYGLPITWKGNVQRIVLTIQHDKKRFNEKTQWVLIRDIGTSIGGQEVEKKVVKNLLKKI